MLDEVGSSKIGVPYSELEDTPPTLIQISILELLLSIYIFFQVCSRVKMGISGVF